MPVPCSTGSSSLTRRVERLECPVVFAAHALCLTWAFELALACDLIVAAESAAFGLVETVVGLTPAMGGTQRLAERAGSGRAREFVMTGRPFDAATMERWGVVNRVLHRWRVRPRGARVGRIARRRPDARPRGDQARDSPLPRGRRRRGGSRGGGDRRRSLFATSDLQNAVRTFLEQGPGKATFEGR